MQQGVRGIPNSSSWLTWTFGWPFRCLEAAGGRGGRLAGPCPSLACSASKSPGLRYATPCADSLRKRLRDSLHRMSIMCQEKKRKEGLQRHQGLYRLCLVIGPGKEGQEYEQPI